MNKAKCLHFSMGDRGLSKENMISLLSDQLIVTDEEIDLNKIKL